MYEKEGVIFLAVLCLISNVVFEYLRFSDIRYLKKHFDKILEACTKGRENNA